MDCLRYLFLWFKSRHDSPPGEKRPEIRVGPTPAEIEVRKSPPGARFLPVYGKSRQPYPHIKNVPKIRVVVHRQNHLL